MYDINNIENWTEEEENEWQRDFYLNMKTTCYTTAFGSKQWLNEEMYPHNTNGPAIIYPDGKCIFSLNGITVSLDEWCKILMKPEEEIVILKLKY